MAHPELQVGSTYSFAAPSGKRSLLTGKVTALSGNVATVFIDGKYHKLDATTARKPRTRKIRRTRRAIERGEY